MQNIWNAIESSARTIVAVSPAMPGSEEITEKIAQVVAGSARGYLRPDEDETVRTIFARYLAARAALYANLFELEPHVRKKVQSDSEEHPELFAVAFCSACMLVRTGRFLIDSFREHRVIWKKLDEAEPRFGIPRKQFTQIFRSATSPRNVMTFLDGIRYWNENREAMLSLKSNPVLKPVIEQLLFEEAYIEKSKIYYAKGRLKYRLHSFLRRHNSGYRNVMFALFEVSGRVIAEMRNQWREKRVTQETLDEVGPMLRPGDVFVTRHDEAASNLFLPGYWPHAILYIGSPEERREIGVTMSEERWARCDSPIVVLEARKDGVLFRSLAEALSVDSFVLIRPKLNEPEIARAISQAIEHEGKGYDFEFDFRRSNCLVCTEVVYRGFHGVGELEFELTQRSGRFSLAAEDLLDHAVEGDGYEVVALFGYQGNELRTGNEAREKLIESYRADRRIEP